MSGFARPPVLLLLPAKMPLPPTEAGRAVSWCIDLDLMKTLLLSIAAVLASAASLLAQATFQLDKATYAPGENVIASWTGSTSTKDWIGIYPRGEVPDGNPVSTKWGYVTGASGSRTFAATAPMGVGQWSAWLLANDGYGVMPGTSAIDFSVANPGPDITAFTASSNFASGSPVTLSWTITNVAQVTSLTLSDGVNADINVTGQTSFAVSPTANTTYTLSASGDAGADTATRLVMVAGSNSPAFSINKAVYEVGEPVVATWAGATANPDSWVGVYAIGATPGPIVSLQWNYLNGTRTAGGSVPDGSMQFTLPVGQYFAVLFVDGGYTIEKGPILFSVVDEINVKVNSVVRAGNGVTIEWQSKTGHEYDIYASNTMEGDPLTWESVAIAVPAESDGTTSYTETITGGLPASRFYKVFEYETISAE